MRIKRKPSLRPAGRLDTPQCGRARAAISGWGFEHAAELVSGRTDIEIGLSQAEAADRLSREGPNALPDPEHRGFWRILGEVLREPMFALLLAGGAVYLVIGDLTEALVLIAFACLSVAIALVQGLRSERVLDALRKLSDPRATVIREGGRHVVPSIELVRGDVIALAEGERVPADAVLRFGHEIEADESLLTGESAPVAKRVSLGMEAPRPPGGDDAPFVYSGSLIVRGQGLAEVTSTGPRSEIGKIGGALQGLATPPTRLTLEVRRIVRVVGAIAIVVCVAVVLLFGLLRGSWARGLLGGIALGMAMLPEEFPLVLTVFMVMGAWRISRAKVLTRRASAIETLGAATVLCTDKTGTLTQNRMTIVRAWADGSAIEWDAGAEPPPPARPLVRVGVLASAPHPFDPMERAFHDAARGWFSAPERWSLERSFGMTRERLAVAQLWLDAESGRREAFVKGAPEAVLALCGLDDRRRADVLAAVEAMAAAGQRVLAVAEDREVGEKVPEAPEAMRFAFLGLVGLADPLRPDVPEAVAECRSAGVRVVMVTGDYPATARAIASRAGIEDGEVLTGDDLRALSDEALAARIGRVTVFARILPEQKLRIVQALQAAGEVAAMTGDGVNDAPALKAADIGIAMGGRGADVAREASALILLNDDFGSIVTAMRLGRRIYDNLQKAMSFVLAVHVPIAGLAIFPLLFGLPVLLAPVHIALLEMVIDPVCSVVFEAEPEETDVMRRPPRANQQRLFTRARVVASVTQGAILLAVIGALYVWGERLGVRPEAVLEVSFLALVLGLLGLVQANRSFAGGLAAFGRWNRPFLGVICILGVTVTVIMGWPQARRLFQFAPVDWRDLAIALGAGATSVVLLVLAKFAMSARSTPPRG
jgi:P-type Ca2+ transporter type 2C